MCGSSDSQFLPSQNPRRRHIRSLLFRRLLNFAWLGVRRRDKDTRRRWMSLSTVCAARVRERGFHVPLRFYTSFRRLRPSMPIPANNANTTVLGSGMLAVLTIRRLSKANTSPGLSNACMPIYRSVTPLSAAYV